MICPRCSHHQPEAAECARCGQLIARWNPDTSRRPAPAASVEPPKSAKLLVPALLALVVLAALAGGAYTLWRAKVQAEAAEAEAAAAAHTHHPTGELPTLEQQASALGCPRRVLAPGAIAEAAAGDPWPEDWLMGAAGWQRANAPERDPKTPRLVYFGTPTCTYAKAVERDILTDRAVKKKIAKMVKVYINPESGFEESEIATEFGVSAYPALVLVHNGRRETARLLRDVDSQLALGLAPDLVAWLDLQLKPATP